MGNWKEESRERTVGDCFGGYASYMSNVASIEPYSEGIKKKFIAASLQKLETPSIDDEHVLVKDFDSKLTNKIMGASK